MSTAPVLRIEINGHGATAGQLGFPALVNYGHFTAIQVRNRRVRGLDLHLTRLDSATRELFGASLDNSQVRDHIRHALGEDVSDASVRVNVFWPDTDDIASIMVTVRPPAAPPGGPQAPRPSPTSGLSRTSSTPGHSRRPITGAWPGATDSMRHC